MSSSADVVGNSASSLNEPDSMTTSCDYYLSIQHDCIILGIAARVLIVDITPCGGRGQQAESGM